MLILLLKTFLNIDSINEHNAHEMKQLANIFLASPIIIGEKSRNGILEEGVIRTYREKEHDILMEMRDGKYMVDGKFTKEFYDYIDYLEAEFELARQRSELPNRPDSKRIDQFVESVNRRVVNGEF